MSEIVVLPWLVSKSLPRVVAGARSDAGASLPRACGLFADAPRLAAEVPLGVVIRHRLLQLPVDGARKAGEPSRSGVGVVLRHYR
jgi:hypothetical protein